MTAPWTHDAPCDNCGGPPAWHDPDTRYCDDYHPIACQATDDHHGGPVRVRDDGAKLCWRHDEARSR